MSQRNGKGHKYNVVCPVKGCKYTSRKWTITSGEISIKNSVFSTKCPKHQRELVDQLKTK